MEVCDQQTRAWVNAHAWHGTLWNCQVSYAARDPQGHASAACWWPAMVMFFSITVTQTLRYSCCTVRASEVHLHATVGP